MVTATIASPEAKAKRTTYLGNYKISMDIHTELKMWVAVSKENILMFTLTHIKRL